MRIDLHAHSTASDGTDTPAGLVRAAAPAGLDVVAITDHDTTAGWAEAADAVPPGLTLVPGAELSTGRGCFRFLHDVGDRGGNEIMMVLRVGQRRCIGIAYHRNLPRQFLAQPDQFDAAANPNQQ